MDRSFASRRRLRGALLALLCIACVAPALAQMPDTTGVVPDTTRRVAPVSRPLLGFPQQTSGVAVGDTILAVVPELNVPDVLAAVPGAFVYDFGAFGWPDGWSPYGLLPRRVLLTWDDVPFDDPVTGRPRYDLLPMALLEPLRIMPAQFGAPMSVHARTRPFAVPRPLTELRYRTGDGGLQSISGLHRQERRWTVLGQPTHVGFLFAYGGHAADNEYPGSHLRRGRQLLGRLRIARSRWSLELKNLHNRRFLGAHGGVLPRGAFETIYSRIEPQVENPDARRRTIRNDLSASAWWQWSADRTPLRVRTYWTAATFRYRNPGSDTLAAETDRYGASVQQRLRLGPHRLTARLDGWTDRLDHSSTLPDAPGLDRTRLTASLRDSLRLGGWATMLAATLDVGDDTILGGRVQDTRRLGPVRLIAEGWRAGGHTSLVERYGWGGFVRPAEALPGSRVTQGRLGVSLHTGWFDVAVFGFAHRHAQPLDLFVVQGDTVAARVADTPFERAGATLDVGLRRTAGRGLYLTAQAAALRLLDADASPLHERVGAGLPDAWGQARLGARLLLFRGDLDLDAALRGRFWSAFRSRTLHPPTGLLVLPPADARVFGPSGTLDLVVRGGIRTATLFLVYENMLSGTALQTGTLLVPVYPLPQQRLRFGVYWPILN